MTTLAALEARIASLEREAGRDKLTGDARHKENGDRLGAIEKSLTEIAVYFKVGRWVMHAVWALGGSVATAFLIKWLGAKT